MRSIETHIQLYKFKIIESDLYVFCSTVSRLKLYYICYVIVKLSINFEMTFRLDSG